MLEGCRAGQGVLLVGAPGIGKTRVASRVADLWRRSGDQVGWVAATKTAGRYPFGAFAALGESLEADDFVVSTQRILRGLRESSTTLLVVDDAHLLDDASAAVVHQLALPNPGRPTLIATISQGAPLPDAIAALSKDGLLEFVQLEPLSDRTAVELVQDLLDGEVDGQTAERLCRLSDGNPNIVTELVGAAVDEGLFVECEGVWSWRGELPSRKVLADLLPFRLDDLDRSIRKVLEMLSLAGALSWSRLVAYGGADAVCRAEADGLITSTRLGRRLEFHIAKPLCSELILASLGPANRRTILDALDGVLDETAALRSTDRLLRAQIRLDLSVRRDDDVALFTEASRIARPDYALAERFARTALERGGGFTAADYLVDALLWQGRFDEAKEIAESIGDDLTPEEREYFDLRWTRMAWWMTGRPPDDSDWNRNTGGEDGGDSVAAASTARQMAMAAAAGHGTEVVPGALKLLDQVDLEDEATCWASGAALIGLGGDGRLTEALSRMPRAYASAHRLTDFNYRLLLSILDARLRRLSGDLTGARTVTDALRAALTSKSGPNLGLVTLAEGELTLAEARPSDAALTLRAAAAALEEVDFGGLSALARCRLGEAFMLGGDTNGALDQYQKLDGAEERILDLYRPELLIAKAWILVGSGNRKAGGPMFDHAAALAEGHGDHLVGLHARHARMRVGEKPAAAARSILPIAMRLEGPYAAAVATHARALASDDVDGLMTAAEAFADCGLLGEAVDAAAHAVRAAKRREPQCDAVGLASRAVALAEMHRVHTPALTALGIGLPLTRRQREVARMAASGRSNKVIAEKLHIGIRTVESHLDAAYRRLGVSNRNALASLVLDDDFVRTSS